MQSLIEWFSRLRSTFRKQRTDEDLKEELRSHLALATREDGHGRGSPKKTAREARLRAGGIPQAMESMRDQRGLPWLEELARDLRHGFLSLARTPGFTAVAVLTLALGIGANTAIFSIVNTVLLRPLPFVQPERLMSVEFLFAGEYLFFRDHARTFESLALYQQDFGFNLSDDVEADRVNGAYVSASFFSTLRAGPLVGRGFLPGEDEPGRNGVVVLSHALWHQRFDARADIIGKDILVDSEPRTVVGVMPPTFAFPSKEIELWVPYSFDRLDAVALWGLGRRGGEAVARLAPGTTRTEAQAELRRLAPDLSDANTLWTPPPDSGTQRHVLPLQDRMVGNVRTRLYIILGAVGFVLLIACANVASLLLARSSQRRREVAIRQALGASRGRLIRQHLTESVVLGLIGGLAGLAMAWSALRLLTAALPSDVPRAGEIAIDGWVLAFVFVISLLGGIALGVVPAFRSTRVRSQISVGLEGRGTTTSLGRVAGLLVITELAVAVLLVIGAGLLIRSFTELLRVDPGFRPAGIVTARVTPPETLYTDDILLPGVAPEAQLESDGRKRALYEEILRRVRELPGVDQVEAVSHLPLSGASGSFIFETEDDPVSDGAAAPVTGDRRITPGYLAALGIPLLAGRGLDNGDRPGSERVAMVNETMARRHWPAEDPVGKRFKEVWLADWTTVVGVVGDVRGDGLEVPPAPEIYRPFEQAPSRDMYLVIRTTLEPAALRAALRQSVASVDPRVPVSEIYTMDEVLSDSVAAPRFTTLLMGGFAGLALLLAALGVYGLLSYLVSRRTGEIGVRIALGAPRAGILGMVLLRALRLACAGTVLGVAAALGTTRLLRTLLFEVSAIDPVTFAAVPALLIAVALLAAYVPAKRATKVDPNAALRLE